MTRLKQENLLSLDLRKYDCELEEKAGKTLAQLVQEGAGLTQPLEMFTKEKAAVIPITAGLGIITGFTAAVESILKHVGLNVKLTENTDMAGISEALDWGANLLFCADDNIFFVLDMLSGSYVDNALATADMFMFAINKLADGLQGKSTLIVGLGKVGNACLLSALQKGAKVYVYDKLPEHCVTAARKYPGVSPVKESLMNACRKAQVIIDASPEGSFIRDEWLSDDVVIGAPGVPLGLEEKAYKRLFKRVIHDCLPLGVAGMVAKVFSQRKGLNKSVRKKVGYEQVVTALGRLD
ncbi:MAG: 3-methylornithyl-N6-L-lysine dehydrogenase PylD [Dethiobacter sp.]|jgi:pyrrolysine biosynthesis protein PylD|nr:MAG: 3-methylornithyl-N6-L-lysine dehydrogenase PylD [Dethiobacter sp.]